MQSCIACCVSIIIPAPEKQVSRKKCQKGNRQDTLLRNPILKKH